MAENLNVTWGHSSDASPRPTRLAGSTNDMMDLIDNVNAVLNVDNVNGSFSDVSARLDNLGDGIWHDWTPVLTATTTNPTVGTDGVNGCVKRGRYAKIGDLVVAYFAFRFARSGTNGGSGTYNVNLPFNCNTDIDTAGMSSEFLGTGTIARNATSFDLFHPPGSLRRVNWHTAPNSNSHVLAVVETQTNDNFKSSLGTAATSLPATPTVTDIAGDGPGGLCAVTIDVEQPNLQFVLEAELPWFSGSGACTLFTEIREGSTNLGQQTSSTSAAGTLTSNTATGHVRAVIKNPTVGSHTYKLSASPTVAATTGHLTFGAQQVAVLTATQVANEGDVAGALFLSDTIPWSWGLNVTGGPTQGPEIWGRLGPYQS